MANAPMCPECHQLDRAVRVRSIYSGGISSQVSGSSGVGLTLTRDGLAPSYLSGRTHGVFQSDLSNRLTPLLAPAPRVGLGGPVGMTIGVTAIVILLVSPIWPASVLLAMVYGVLLVPQLRRERFRKTVVMSWYQKYLRAWGGLYYCERCDVVFAAGSKKAVRPSDMTSLLFEIVGHEPRYGEAKVESGDGPGAHRLI
jgi:hypothetical protein